MTSAKFITFEGADGSGKSTQAVMLSDRLKLFGISVTLTREPGGTDGAEQIRSLLVEGKAERWSPLCEALLHYAARRDHMEKTIIPSLEAGSWVVSDRFADSTMAYQGYGRQLGREMVERLHELVVGDLVPDLTIILDVPQHLGLHRAASRKGSEDRYERMEADFHARLCSGFLDIASHEPNRCVVMDAARTVDEIHNRIVDVAEKRFEIKLR